MKAERPFRQVWLNLLLSISLVGPVVASADEPRSAAEIIAEARKYDCNYCPQDKADREKAIAIYESVLLAGPDKEQKLYVLFRLAQLNDTNYFAAKGEKPRYAKAARYYDQIIEEYGAGTSPTNPPTEPLVYKALLTRGDHKVTAWQFGEALRWYNRVLSYDAGVLFERWQALRKSPETAEEAAQLANVLKEIVFYQKVAVGQIAYASSRMEVAATESEMFRLSRQPQKHIADKASEILATIRPEVFQLPEGLDKPYTEPPTNAEDGPAGSVRDEAASDTTGAAITTGNEGVELATGGPWRSVGIGLLALGGVMGPSAAALLWMQKKRSNTVERRRNT